MLLWTIGFILSLIFLFLMLMLWIRKMQFDAIHRNFLELETEFGGGVIRNGFASRPRYSGSINGQKISISFTSEGGKDGRKYYISVYMHAKPRIVFAVKSIDWLGAQEESSQPEDRVAPLGDGQYLIETTTKGHLKRLNMAKIDNAVGGIHPFAYILIGKSALLLERTSDNLTEDTKSSVMKALINSIYDLKLVVEA